MKRSLVCGMITARRSLRRLGAVAWFCLLASCGAAAQPANAPARELESGPAPEVEATYVTGTGPRTLAEAKGRVVIVDFFATYCDPCARSFPRYEALRKEYGDALAVIAVSLDTKDEAATASLKTFAKDQRVTFPIVWDNGAATRDAYGPHDLPTSFIIDGRGTIRFVHPKYEAGDEDKMEAEIRSLLPKGSP